MITANTNCPNCGAPIDIHAEKCAYCDTPYVFRIGKRISDLEEKVIEFKLEVMRDNLYEEALKATRVCSMNETRRRFGIRGV